MLITKNKVMKLFTNITSLSLDVANVPMKETKGAGTQEVASTWGRFGAVIFSTTEEGHNCGRDERQQAHCMSRKSRR